MKMPRLSAVAIATGLAFLSGVAIAQNPGEVKVEATRLVNARVVGQTEIGVPIQDLTLTYGVSLTGLNLATHSGALQAEKRVNDAALAACKEISRQYPESTPDDFDCARAAASKAMTKVHELVATAEKPASK